ncbi:MAG: molecular chaperone HtpG, partial [Methanomicrobia archaeon]|nr:molecular chaperone HtpG [Methanomicrobia archaeon]
MFMAEKQAFKTESKRLLDLMVHSIYTNREIFIRELISNASDAIDKYHLLSLTDEKLPKRSDYQIQLEVNPKKRTFKITDNGIGMTKDELINNLGTIAASGSRDFLNKISDEKLKKEAEIIGQFGVGFYSAFLVAKKVLVETKSPYDDKAYSFESDGTEFYEIDEIKKDDVGTSITLFLRDNGEDDKYDEFTETYRIESLVKKYSDYVRFPIKMEVEESLPKLDKEGNPIKDKYETKKVIKTLNSMVPLWRKAKKDVTEQDLAEFYKNKFNDFEDPLKSVYASVEGLLSYNTLLFIPKHAPYNLYSEN